MHCKTSNLELGISAWTLSKSKLVAFQQSSYPCDMRLLQRRDSTSQAISQLAIQWELILSKLDKPPTYYCTNTTFLQLVSIKNVLKTIIIKIPEPGRRKAEPSSPIYKCRLWMNERMNERMNGKHVQGSWSPSCVVMTNNTMLCMHIYCKKGNVIMTDSFYFRFRWVNTIHYYVEENY